MSRPVESADVAALAPEALHAVPTLGPNGPRMAVVLYRLLARGAPVADEELAAEIGLPPDEVRKRLDTWPAVFRDGPGHVIGFWGLALLPTDHEIEVSGHRLSAWCAWDALFLPRILATEVRVTSADPGSGEPIRLVVGPAGVVSADPERTVLSFVRLAEAGGFGDNVISNFCHHIRFFTSPESGAAWAGDRDDVVLLSLDEGVELARRWVEGLYGEVLSAG